MKNCKTLFQEVVAGIKLEESPEETNSLAYFLLTSVFGITKTDILAGIMVPFPDSISQGLQKSLQRINRGEPVQYVVGEEYFYGRKFYVNPSVLIPRPETEGLIRVILSYQTLLAGKKDNRERLRILDIGTGSGCVAVTLFHELPGAEIYATDISNAALSVALNNAEVHKADITFFEHNILTENIPLTDLDIIVSNPPYVTQKERGQMKPNVLDHEPHQALFVPAEDPLVFHNVIARQAKVSLKTNGLLAMEINESFGDEVSEHFIEQGLKEVAIVQDIAGKDRIIMGVKG